MALKGPDEGAMKAFLRLSQGSFAAISALRAALRAQPAASFFLGAQKEAKEAPGGDRKVAPAVLRGRV